MTPVPSTSEEVADSAVATQERVEIEGTRVRRSALYLIGFIGIGLIAAPAIFQMFTRAPKGGQMLKELGPFMSQSKVDSFRGYLDVIGRADNEAQNNIRPLVKERLRLSDTEFDRAYPFLAEFDRQWPTIDQDMNGMLTTMEENLDNFAAVDALPPFVLFPWFFVLPGLMLAGLSIWALRAEGGGAPSPTAHRLLLVVGLGLIAAPAIFQMFTRAPLGGDLINDFRSLMTTDKVTTVQQYFLTIGTGEGEVRGKVKSDLKGIIGVDDAQYARRFPSVAALERDWSRIAGEMAPMVGAMSDNVDNFQAVDALPPFPLFPWFFVAPGVLVAGAAVAAGLRKQTIGGSNASS